MRKLIRRNFWAAALTMPALMIGLMPAVAPIKAYAQDRPAQVLVDAVIEESLAETVPVIGRVVARQQGVIAAKVEGPIAEMMVEVGDRVATGDVLARLDPARLELTHSVAKAEHDAALAQMESTRSQIQLLTQERNRLEQLRNSAAFSRAAFDDKTNEIAVERARLQAEQARVSMALVRMQRSAKDVADALITAPYPGVVIRRMMSAGAYVRTGEAIAEMVNDNNLEIEADIPAERIAGLKPGLVVDAELEDGQKVHLEFRAVIPIENSLTRTRAVRFVPVANGSPAHVDTAGESVTVAIPVGASRSLVTVHKDAVTIAQGQRNVFVVDGDKAVPRSIEIGASIGSRFEITDGSLEVGDLVVVRGNERLRPGQTVTYPDASQTSVGQPQKPDAAKPEANRQQGRLDRQNQDRRPVRQANLVLQGG